MACNINIREKLWRLVAYTFNIEMFNIQPPVQKWGVV